VPNPHDGNPQTAGDPTWLPLMPTPAYPEYTSGANNLTGAMTRTLELFFGDKLTFTVTSTPVNKSMAYDRFSDMADDVVIVRIYQGIHFHSADAVARRQGTRAADWASAISCGLSNDDEGQPPDLPNARESRMPVGARASRRRCDPPARAGE
jgi:hypothetical protein